MCGKLPEKIFISGLGPKWVNRNGNGCARIQGKANYTYLCTRYQVCDMTAIRLRDANPCSRRCSTTTTLWDWARPLFAEKRPHRLITGKNISAVSRKYRYLLEEHLLELPQARPELGALLAAPQELLGTDEFQLFPSSVRPQNLCAIVGGVGARSFLHR